MAGIRNSILATALIALVAGVGLAYVGIPTVDPNYNSTNQKTQTTTINQQTTETMTVNQQVTQTVTVNENQTGVIQQVSQSWQNESYIYDNQLSWSLMYLTQLNFTTYGNSRIVAQFSAPYLLSVDATFTGKQYYVVSLIIQDSGNTIVGNTTYPIIYFDSAPATGYYRELNYYPTLTVMTDFIAAGTYNCSVQWRSTYDAPGTNDLSVSHTGGSGPYHFDRWMIIEEIIE